MIPNVFAIISGLLSSVPAALAAWDAIAPHLDAKLTIPDDDKARVLDAIQEGHAAVELWHGILASPSPAGATIELVTQAVANASPPANLPPPQL
jgi:hypothetical protein